MRYYLINTMPMSDKSFCFLDQPPEGTNAYTHRMAEGDAMGSHFPKNAKAQMDKRYGGTKLPSLIANTDSFLILDQAMKDVVEREAGVSIEFLRFSLLDPKRKVASDAYYIVNVLGTFDCLDLDNSDIEMDDGEIVEIRSFVLSKKKLDKAPDLFRIQEAPSKYVGSQRLLLELKKLSPTNLYVTELKQA